MEKKKLTKKQEDFAKNIIKMGKKNAKKCAELAGYKKNPENWAKKLLKNKAIQALIKDSVKEVEKKASKHKNNTSFSKDYQPQEKWTLERALEVGNDLIQWLMEEDAEGNDKGNIFFKEFLIMKNDYSDHLLSYLKDKYKPFLHLLKRAEAIQELKLQKYGVGDRLNATMTKFVLINKHNWRDKVDVQSINTNLNKEIDEVMTPQEASNLYSEQMKK